MRCIAAFHDLTLSRKRNLAFLSRKEAMPKLPSPTVAATTNMLIIRTFVRTWLSSMLKTKANSKTISTAAMQTGTR